MCIALHKGFPKITNYLIKHVVIVSVSRVDGKFKQYVTHIMIQLLVTNSLEPMIYIQMIFLIYDHILLINHEWY